MIQNHLEGTDVLCLQDLGLPGQLIHDMCGRFAPGWSCCSDLGNDDRIGALLMVGPSWEVIEGGNRGDGSFVWCVVESEIGPLYVGSVNAHEQELNKHRCGIGWSITSHKDNGSLGEN